MVLSTKEFVSIFEAWAAIIRDNKENLIELDQIAGDGDLGLSMMDGFSAMLDYVQANAGLADLGLLFYNAGKTMNVHASSSLGTLISSGFMEAGKVFKGKTEMSGCEIGTFLDAFQRGIINRGKAKVGEKTFLDGFDPAVRVMMAVTSEDQVKEVALRAAAAAQQGSAQTVGMIACWGRAARRGEDSRQILDPGSVVASLLVTALADFINRQE